jgi:geranylgeranyl pyrophosphate synthase
VAQALAILDAGQGRAYAEGLARQHLDNALSEMVAARPESEAREALEEMARFLVQRAY